MFGILFFSFVVYADFDLQEAISKNKIEAICNHFANMGNSEKLEQIDPDSE
ncbi:hypothetical protein [Candidatus Uabimicrobium sp. HlEnr_7]|uniref:hypothetical protein n=1 Tax=Candidatus Uabimicrobium helgolandensis TaxID=3095367 RepID=UPI003555D065